MGNEGMKMALPSGVVVIKKVGIRPKEFNYHFFSNSLFEGPLCPGPEILMLTTFFCSNSLLKDPFVRDQRFDELNTLKMMIS